MYLEDLKTKNLTKTVRGIVENTGEQVQQRNGLNAVALKTGWH